MPMIQSTESVEMNGEKRIGIRCEETQGSVITTGAKKLLGCCACGVFGKDAITQMPPTTSGMVVVVFVAYLRNWRLKYYTNIAMLTK